MATDQLSLYNIALTDYLGERKLASLTENREPRRALDDIWQAGNGVVQACLEQGHWKFATRTSQMNYDPSITPAFGYQRAVAVPSDLVRTSKVCQDEYFNVPLTQYAEEAKVFYSDLDIFYLSYVSNAAGYGNNLSAWPDSFVQYVACYMAAKACMRITQSVEKLQYLTGPKGDKGLLHTRRVDALSKDASEMPTKFLPKGAWASARTAGGADYFDGGSRSRLIG